MNRELIKYIESERAKKSSDASIKEVLLKTGWKEEEIDDALGEKKVLPPPPSIKETFEEEAPHKFFTLRRMLLFGIPLTIIALLIPISVLLLASIGDTTVNYTSKEDNFSVDYPKNWKISSNVGKVDLTMDDSSSPQAGITIELAKIEEVCDKESCLVKSSTVDDFFRKLEKTEQVKAEKGTFAGEKAYKVSGNVAGYKYQKMYVVKNGNIYSVAYAAKPEFYEKYKSTANSVFSSFKFIK